MIDKKVYSSLVKKASPNSKKFKNGFLAFIIGGLICVIGQLFKELYETLGFSEDVVKMAVPATLIFIAALLTGLKVFDNIAKFAGAGTLVPITGFSNAVTAPAIEFKREGFVLGVGANIFKIAGPVIAYGVAASVIYGVVYWITTLF